MASHDAFLSLNLRYSDGDLDFGADGFDDLASAEEIMHILDRNYESSKFLKDADPEKAKLKAITTFIGHGRSRLWRDLKDHLQDHHGITVSAYETGARGGYTITEVLEEMASSASIALLVHTSEDVTEDGQMRARENVVHETGLFQGKLGFKRAIVLLEEGTSEFSNIAGLQQVRFKKGNIKEIFGDVLAILRREFGDKNG